MAEPLRATFYTFREHGPRRGVILGATLTTAALALLLIAGLVGFAFMMFGGMGGAAPVDPGAQVGGIFAMLGLVFVAAFLLYLLFASFEAACLRWMIRREAPGLFGLTLGADTWRVYAGYWLWLLISMGVSMTVSMIMMPFMFFLIVPMAESGAPEAAIPGMIGMQVAINGVYYLVMAFIAVRFAPAAATSIARRKFSFFLAWNVTKGRFWALFGSFLVLMSFYLLLLAVFVLLTMGALFSVLPMPGSQTSPEQMSEAFAQLFTPQNLAMIGGFYILLLLVGVFYVVMSYGVNARAVIAAVDEGKIEGESPNVAEVFS